MEKISRGLMFAAVLFSTPTQALAQSSNTNLLRALIAFKSHLTAGISYVEYSPAVADLNTEIELAERTRDLSSNAKSALTLLQADSAVIGEVWRLRFGPLASPDSSFTFCESEIGKLFASTGATFKEQGLLDADLKTEDLSGQCAYYNDSTMATLLSAVAKQADKSIDALAAIKKPMHKHH